MATATHFEPLPSYLADIQRQMEAHARNYGLDFFPTIFEVVDCDHAYAQLGDPAVLDREVHDRHRLPGRRSG